jgi:hypothetical protein
MQQFDALPADESMISLQVRRFSILTRIFSVKTGELQPGGQLNRLAIKKQNKYDPKSCTCVSHLVPSDAELLAADLSPGAATHFRPVA